MTFTITKVRLGIAIVTIALLAPATAFATHRFPDVTHGPPFEAAINWAADNGITTGFGDGTFGPDLPVTRAQNVTFAHRYDTNVVQPGFLAILNAVQAAAPTITRIQYGGVQVDTTVTTSWEKTTDLGVFTKAQTSTDIVLGVDGHSDQVATTSQFCHWQIRVDGLTDVGAASTVYSGTDSGNVVAYGAGGAWFAQALFPSLSAGVHTVELWLRGSATSCTNNKGNFTHNVIVTEVISQG